jgi:hypothetical protein
VVVVFEKVQVLDWVPVTVPDAVTVAPMRPDPVPIEIWETVVVLALASMKTSAVPVERTLPATVPVTVNTLVTVPVYVAVTVLVAIEVTHPRA